jgi:hypothetical protein
MAPQEVSSCPDERAAPRPMPAQQPQLSPGSRSNPNLGAGCTQGPDLPRRPAPPSYKGSLRPGSQGWLNKD